MRELEVRTHPMTDQEVWTAFVPERYRKAARQALKDLSYESEPQDWYFVNIGRDLEPSDLEARSAIYEALCSACEFDA